MGFTFVIADAMGIPVAVIVAILKYRLYDIDLIINRTLVYGSLTASVVGLYVLLVGGLGVFLQARGNFVISLLATGLVAVLFQPLRERLQRGVNRLMYGERDEPAVQGAIAPRPSPGRDARPRYGAQDHRGDGSPGAQAALRGDRAGATTGGS